MSGRRRNHATGGHSSSFSFLDTLICTMGVLLVLLHAFARHGEVQVGKEVEETSKRIAVDAKAERESLEWDMEQLQESRAKTEAQLAEERLKLSHIEDHERRLRERFEKLKIAAAEMEHADSTKIQERRQKLAELEDTKLKLVEARKAVADTRRRGEEQATYSVVPYEGPQGTRRRPIYIECRADCLVLQPEGIVLAPDDFVGFTGPGNPLASALRGIREYWSRQANGGKQSEPYPLLLVRPEGIEAYYEARTALDSWGADFGYELIGTDWQLTFPEPDQQLAELTKQVVADARVRQREFVSTTAQLAKNRGRPGLRASSRGGFVPERGTRGGGRGPGGDGWESLGSNWARRGSSASRSGSDGGGSSTVGGSSTDSTGSTGYGTESGGGSDRSYAETSGSSANPYAGLGNGTGPGGASGIGMNAAGSGTGGFDRYGQPQAGGGYGPGGVNAASGLATASGGGSGSSVGNGLPGDAVSQTGSLLQGGSGSQTGSASGSSGIASAQSGLYGSGGNSPSTSSMLASANGSSGTQNGSGSQNGSSTQYGPGSQNANGSSNGSGTQNAQGSLGRSGSQDATGSQSGAGTPSGSGSQSGSSTQASPGSPSGSSSPGTSGSGGGSGSSPASANPATPTMPAFTASSQSQKTNSMAKSRGRDWGLPDSAGTAAATRPVLIECYNDRLVILPENRNELPKEVPLGPKTQESMDEFVADVWKHMKGWGTAGKGMYWRPSLLMEVKPGAADRYAEVKNLLSDSGLDVHERQAQPTAARPTTKKTRK
jgi:hypothetical protein